MGRQDRERIARIEAGKEKSISQQAREGVAKLANNPIGRQILKRASHKGVVEELSKGDVTDQVHRLDSMAGTGELPGGELARTIKSKAPKEMDKAIKKFKKQGNEITVESLCAEIKSTPGFLQMCNNAGITLEWFEDLARERMEANGVTQ